MEVQDETMMRSVESGVGDGGEEINKVCCLCGDIGFAGALSRCSHCDRLQHTYCSRYYPDNVDKENWRCEWCLHRQQLQQQQQQRHHCNHQKEEEEEEEEEEEGEEELEVVIGRIKKKKKKTTTTVVVKEGGGGGGAQGRIGHQQQQNQIHVKVGPSINKVSNKSSSGGSSKAVDRWRKLARAAKGGGNRRYKLLADVLCS